MAIFSWLVNKFRKSAFIKDFKFCASESGSTRHRSRSWWCYWGPKISIWLCTQKFYTSRSCLQRVLHSYKVKLIYYLKPTEHAQRMRNDKNWIFQRTFLVVSFILISFANSRIYCVKTSLIIAEKQTSKRVTVWSRIWVVDITI